MAKKRKAAADVAEGGAEVPVAPVKRRSRRAVPAVDTTGKSLIIVESPAKAKTINKYLGKDFIVEASVGHIKNLPKSKIGIDVEHGFRPEYETIKGKDEVIARLRSQALKAKAVYLATDPDRRHPMTMVAQRQT